MLNFMHEGGFGMWAILIAAVASLATAVVRRRKGGRAGLHGALACLALGALSFSTGLYNTVAAATAAANTSEILCIGIRESANNTLFGAALALLLLLASAALKPRRPPTRTA